MIVTIDGVPPDNPIMQPYSTLTGYIILADTIDDLSPDSPAEIDQFFIEFDLESIIQIKRGCSIKQQPFYIPSGIKFLISFSG